MLYITPISAPFYFTPWCGPVEMCKGKILALNHSRSKSSLLVNLSTSFFLSWFCFSHLEDDTEAEIFQPLLSLLCSGFTIRVCLFFPSSLLFFPFPTANRVVGEYKISQFRQRPNIPREQERKRDRHDQPLPNKPSQLYCAFPPFSENYMKRMGIMRTANSQCIQWPSCLQCFAALPMPCCSTEHLHPQQPSAAFPQVPADKRAGFCLFHRS